MNQKKASNRSFGSSEGLTLEFKRAKGRLPGNLFETVCAFLNLDGGLIVLGVEDNGAISGIDPDAVERLKTNIANLSNNPQKLDPPYLIYPHEQEIEGKWVIKVQVPASSQVHRSGGEVYLRSEDGDYRIKDPYQIAGLVNRKLSFYTEQRVLPWLGMGDLRADLFEQARTLLNAQRRNHPWVKLSDKNLLQIGGFIRKDPLTSETGYTLAAALMFGTDATIQEAAPAMVFDALLRRDNVDRYDDRVMLYTNLIEAFDGLMAFVEKHLNDPFYLDGTERVSLRDRIFRELVSNLIAHREYTSAAPASITIFRDKVVFSNPHVPHIQGRIDPAHFTPFPKNPTLCRFMLQMGRYEQAGSGVYNVTKYLPIYSRGASPIFEEYTDVFVTTIPLMDTKESLVQIKEDSVGKSGLESGLESRLESETSRKTMNALTAGPLQRSEIAKALGHDRVSGAINRAIKELLAKQFIEYTLPDKPNSRLQKYRLTDKGRKAMQPPKEVS